MRALRKHKHRQFHFAVVATASAVAFAAVFLTPKIMQH